MKKEIKVEISLTDGYKERFTAECIKVAQKRVEKETKKLPIPEKVAAAV